MPDIAKCANPMCPLRTKCYRYRCIPSPYIQAYADFKPEPRTGSPVPVVDCSCFLSIEGYDKKDLLSEDYVCGNPFGVKDG